MDSQKRLMLALGLSFALTTIYTLFFMPRPPPPDAALGADAGTAASPPSAKPPDSTAQAPTPPEKTPQPSAPEQPEIPLRRVDRQSDALLLSFSNQGAGLTRAELQGEKMREQPQISLGEGFRRLFGKKEGPDVWQMDMAFQMADQPLPLTIGVTGNRPFPENARYQTEESADGKKLTFTARQNGLEVVKVFEWPRPGFEMAMTVTVTNVGADPISGEMAVHYARGVIPGSEEEGGYLSGVGNLSYATCLVGETMEQKAPDDEPTAEFRGPIQFFGVNQQYFLGTLFPLEGPREGRCVMKAAADGRATTAFFPIQIPAGQSVTQRFGVFIGPKDVELLRTVSERLKQASAVSAAPTTRFSLGEGSYPHLDKAVDFGIWAVLCKLLLGILKFFYSVFSNWGVAIIALTVLVKVVLLPLSHKAMVSAEQLKKLQPKVEEIRKKYADDRDRQNLEMMKVYQEAKVNPFGGCLPMLLQMPVWIALFNTLRNSYELYREPFIAPLWADLTYKDPTYILPVALGVTMIITQMLQPQMMDPVQAKIMTWFMPIFFTFIMLQYPAGLTLYIFTNNVLSIAQQYGLKRYMEKKGIAAPPPHARAEKRAR